MKFSIGDKIILNRTGEEGTVTGYIGKDMLEVEVNGVHFPVYADEVDHPYLKWFTEKKKPVKKASQPEQLPVEKTASRGSRLARGIYLSFMPVFMGGAQEDIVEQLKVYLINETPHAVRFSYDVRVAGSSTFQLSGVVHPFAHLYLHAIDYADMNDHPRFHWQLSDADDLSRKEEEGVLRIKPARVFEHINELLLKNEPTFYYLLVEDFIARQDVVSKANSWSPPPVPDTSRKAKIQSFKDLPRYEVDLHIEQLTDNFQGLSNAEMMNIQLNALQRFLHLAIVHRQERMVIIHGLGTGALRDAVHRLLRETPEVKSFRNEYMAKYGFGATEVIFYQ